jgi:hypothetical protein
MIINKLMYFLLNFFIKDIYIIEQGIFMNGCEFEYSPLYYTTSLQKAKKILKEYIFFMYEENINNNNIKKINSNYWSYEYDFETKYGILKQKLK